MSFELQKNVVGKFMAYDRAIDTENFHALASGGLHNFGYTGISYASDDPDNVSFHFEGDIDTVNLPEIHDALDRMLSGFSSGSLVELKLETLTRINQYRDNWMGSYFPYAGKTWDCDDAGMTNIQGTNLSCVLLVSAGQTLPSNFVFRSRDNTNVPANIPFMAGMGLTLFKFRGDCYMASWIHKYMIAIAITEAEILAYDYTVGWPNREA
mgnify:CR=1 FL=1